MIFSGKFPITTIMVYGVRIAEVKLQNDFGGQP